MRDKNFEEILGQKVVDFLNLSPIEFSRKVYKTSWGSKSLIGLGASLQRLIDEAREESERLKNEKEK